MTNEMLAIIEEARTFSAKKLCTIAVMSNGKRLTYINLDHGCSHRWMKEDGYWVAMIFENGHRVEA